MIYEGEGEGDILMTRAEVIGGCGSKWSMTKSLSRKRQEKISSMGEEFEQWCEEENPEPSQHEKRRVGQSI